MKKLFKTLALALMGVMALSSCEDVPSPYNLPVLQRETVEPMGSGTIDDPWNVAAVRAALQEGNYDSSTEYFIKGVVTAITEISTSFGNATFYIGDSKNSTKTFYAYRVMGKNGEKITSADYVEVGDTVVIKSQVTVYNGTFETVTNKGQIVSNTKGEGNGEGGNDKPVTIESSKENPLTITQALTATGQMAYVKGYIAGFIDGKSMNDAVLGTPSEAQTEVLITEHEGDTVKAHLFPVQLPVGAIREALDLYANPQIFGSEVILYGSIETYFSVTGMKNTSWCKINNKEVGKDPDAKIDEGTPEGNGTIDSPFNVAGAVAYCKSLGADKQSDKDIYVKGIVYKNKTKEADLPTYGNMTLDLIDAGNTENIFGAYQVFGPGKQWFTSLDQVKEGDEVLVCGPVINFKGNTPETVGKGAAYIVSINGKGADDQPEQSDPSLDEKISIDGKIMTWIYPGTKDGSKNETISMARLGFTNAQEITKITTDWFTVEFGKGTAEKNSPKYYEIGTNIRIYPGNTVTVSPNENKESISISKVVLTCDEYQETICVGQKTATLECVNGKMIYTNAGNGTGTGAQARIKEMKIYFNDDTANNVKVQRFAKRK